MKEKLLIEIPIPMEWTGDQAKAVWEFLVTLETAIFSAHETEIMEAIEEELRDKKLKKNREIDYAQFKEDIPF